MADLFLRHRGQEAAPWELAQPPEAASVLGPVRIYILIKDLAAIHWSGGPNSQMTKLRSKVYQLEDRIRMRRCAQRKEEMGGSQGDGVQPGGTRAVLQARSTRRHTLCSVEGSRVLELREK